MAQFGNNSNGGKGETGNMIRDQRNKSQGRYDSARINSAANDKFSQTADQYKGEVKTATAQEDIQTKIGAPADDKQLNGGSK